MSDIWLGAITGIFIASAVWGFVYLAVIGKWYVGDLREDRSSGDERPLYFMEIAQGGYRHMQSNKFVLLRIKRENYIKEGENHQ